MSAGAKRPNACSKGALTLSNAFALRLRWFFLRIERPTGVAGTTGGRDDPLDKLRRGGAQRRGGISADHVEWCAGAEDFRCDGGKRGEPVSERGSRVYGCRGDGGTDDIYGARDQRRYGADRMLRVSVALRALRPRQNSEMNVSTANAQRDATQPSNGQECAWVRVAIGNEPTRLLLLTVEALTDSRSHAEQRKLC
ncbi:hypothetical protein L1887_59644 [Cichorium endivia]|nr:hypothetical protein L1887_59644 [Cichorium endivia]